MPVVKMLRKGEVYQVEGGGIVAVGSDSYLTFNTAVRFNGAFEMGNTYWEDLRFSSAGINPPGAASDPALDTTDGRYSFSASAENILAIQVQMPHSWKQGTALHPHVHWSPTNTNTGDVKWQLKYKVANINEAFPGSWTTLTTLDAGAGVADTHQLIDFDDIDMTGKTFSCMLLILLSRLGADDQDTYNAACKLNEFDIHYQIDSFGTDDEYAK